MAKYVFGAFLGFRLSDALSVQPESVAQARRLAKASVEREVVVCRGVGDMKEEDFKAMGEVWTRYASEGIITGTSPLLYRILPDGKFAAYGDAANGKDFELWSNKYLSPPKVKLIPHVFCDSTCCDTCQLPKALVHAMARRKEFFAESIAAAQKFGWDGYAMDFEGGMPDIAEASKFFQEWKEELKSHKGKSGRPLEMHMWSPSGLDEASISPSMNAMITMNTYHYGSYSSLLEGGTNASSNWRKARAATIYQKGSVDAICPAGLAVPHKVQPQSLLEGATVSREQRVKGLDEGIDQWCQNVKGNSGECGIGLITYDLANSGLLCSDMVKLAKGGRDKGMRSIWLWSGGIIPTHWEQGLRQFSAASSPTFLAEDVCKPPLAALQFQSDCGCSFDGNYCCNGQNRKPKM
jgi:hypothetical protein